MARSGQRQFHYELAGYDGAAERHRRTLRHQTAGKRDRDQLIGDLPVLVSDRLAVEQIFGNLLDNAVKYLDDSRLGRIEIRAQALRPGHLFEIEDNGRGIDPRISAAFSICSAVVENRTSPAKASGWRIRGPYSKAWRQDQLPVGIWQRQRIFRFCCRRTMPAEADGEQSGREGRPLTGSVSIVMIEDDEGHARLIEKNIRRAGITNEIIPFVDGREALDFIDGAATFGKPGGDRRFLILLDLNLPDMSGLDILAKVKTGERTKRIPHHRPHHHRRQG